VALNQGVAMTEVSGGILYNNFANGTRCTTINGMFYAFDHKGKMRWNSRIKNQMLVLEQFQNMPLVLFTTRYNRMAQGGRWQTWVAATESIDKKTGKYLYLSKPKDYPNGFQFYALNLNVKNSHIDLVGSINGLRHSLDEGKK
jgi:hypothetical protein